MLANTTYTIKADWTNNSIDQLNCDELKGALHNAGFIDYDVKYLKKEELREKAYAVLARLHAQKAENDAFLEAQRVEKLNAERADEKVVAGLTAIADALQAAYDSAKETIAKFQKKVAEANVETNGICSELEWHADNVFAAYATMDQVINHERYFRGQATGTAEKQHTLAEIKQHLHDCVERRVNDALRVSMSQSTNPIANVRSLAELKAKGQCTHMLKNLEHYFDEIVTEDASTARYIGWF